MSTSVEQLTAGLYAIPAGGQPSASYAYFLLLADPGSPLPLPSLDDLWNLDTLTGWYVFSTFPITDFDTFKASARAKFPVIAQPANLLPRGMVWLADPGDTADLSVSLVWGKDNSIPSSPRKLRGIVTFTFSAFALQAAMTTPVTFTGDAFTIGSADGNQNLTILYGNQVQQQTVLWYGPQQCSMVLPLTGPLAGALQFQIALNLIPVQANFGCVLAYFSASGPSVETFAYPVFTPPPPSPQVFNGFNVRLDPLNPLDSSRTRFAFDLSGTSTPSKNNQILTWTNFRAINGATITLQPQDPGSTGIETSSPWLRDSQAAGFGFCLTPSPGSLTPGPGLSYYLAPTGQYRIQGVASTQDGPSLPPQDGTPLRWMCGLFGQEYLQLAIGDSVEFVSGQPAFANSAAQPSSPNAHRAALDDTYTTSWLRISPDLRATQDAVSPRGYFAQPSASVFFAKPQDSDFPLAVDALLSPLDDAVLAPVVPYGGFSIGTPAVWPAGANAPSGATLAAFEAGVLSSARHSALAVPGRGPSFQISQPMLAGVRTPAVATRNLRSALQVDPAGTAMTPQGLIVTLDGAGEWLSVLLAKSPDNAAGMLQFRGASGSPSIVSTDLSSVLMQNQLSLVVTNPAPLGVFDNNLDMGGFHFQFNVGLADTILVFKYNTSVSLADMLEDTSMWAAKETFVGTPDDVEAARAVLANAIAVARAEAHVPGNPFDYFNGFSVDPAWTGILAFHAAIDGNGMPPDLQMLLGGIDGQLRAHHFGLEANHVEKAGNQLQIQKSSLLGVIHYDNPSTSEGTGDFQYAVETLTVVFRNSMISQLQVSIGMTLNRLFERPVQLLSGSAGSPTIPNTMVIQGQYQNQDGIGAVLFSTNSAFDYSFANDNHVRVLDHVEITQASLAPTGSNPSGSPQGGGIMTASFGMTGDLYFAAAPFPQDPTLDLFSYGRSDGGGGLSFSSMTVVIAFELDSSGKRTAPPTLSMDLTAVYFQAAPPSIRQGSLLYSLPLQLSRFWYAPAGLSPSALGAVPIHCLQLESNGTVASPDQTGPYPAVATAPHFALEYDMPLGTLGSLSEVTVGIVAKLLIAWGPSNVIPDNDAALVLVQLPEVFGGAGGFALQGILRTTFGDANLLKVDLDEGPVYAVLFSNIKFSVLGYSFPPGILIDFVLFAGAGDAPGSDATRNASNIAWFLAAQQTPPKPSGANSSYKTLEGVR